MFVLDGVCMKLIFIGESVKTIDKLSEGELFPLYPVIPWKEIMKLRDVIAHHYFKIDVDIVYSTMKEDLPLLQATLLSMKQAFYHKPFINNPFSTWVSRIRSLSTSTPLTIMEKVSCIIVV